jgi:hypothetical protein
MGEEYAEHKSSLWEYIQLTASAVGVQFDSERIYVRLIDWHEKGRDACYLIGIYLRAMNLDISI